MLAVSRSWCQYGRTWSTRAISTTKRPCWSTPSGHSSTATSSPTVREVEHANDYPEAWIEQMKRIGIFGLAVPEEYGGTPVSTRCYVLVTQELARGWMSLAGAMGGHTVVAKLIGLFGTEEQKQRYLPAMATGEMRATMALTEPGGGSDLQNMTTTARPDGDDLVINGAKTWITNARRSGLIALLCKTDPDARAQAPGHLGGARRARRRADGVARSAQARLQGRRIVRAGLLRLPDPRLGDPRRRARQGVRADDEGARDRPHPGGLPRPRRGDGRARGCAGVRAGARELRPADLEAPGHRQLPGRHGHQADRRAPADAATRPTGTTAASAPTWRPGWPSCSPPRWRWRSR